MRFGRLCGAVRQALNWDQCSRVNDWLCLGTRRDGDAPERGVSQRKEDFETS